MSVKKGVYELLRLFRHHARLVGWSCAEVVRTTADDSGTVPCVDFIADAECCPVCGGVRHVHKSKRRFVATLEIGAFQAREIRKVFSVDRPHPVMASERLARLVPRRQGYGYDLIVQVGLARYLRNLQREEIRAELLREHGIVVSEGTITTLCDRFLKYLERLHLGTDKQKLRRRLGRANLGRDLEDQPAQAVLASNLRHPDYVRLLSGSLENLPAAFAKLDHKQYREGSPLQRSNKDTNLLKRIRVLVGDEQTRENNRTTNQQIRQSEASPTEI